MEQEELIERDVTLTVQLPGGQEKAVTVHGSKPVMDLLVTLCAQYHLNPSDHVIKLISTNQNQIKFKPSSLIGSLEAERVVLKPKGSDDRSIRVSNMPVATVRLMINYRTSHKAVVRVDPRAPLAEIMPAVCEKCEFDPNATVLLRDSQSEDPLDLSKSLNDYGIRDLYAKDTKACEEEKVTIPEKHQREKENKGFLGLFRRSKKTPEDVPNTSGAPTSPARDTQVVNVGFQKANSPTSTPFADMPKKRRAPQPPSMMASQSFPSELSSSQAITLPSSTANGTQGVLSRVSSTESSLKRTKRRAPPPPCSSTSIQDCNDKERFCVGASLNLPSLEEAQEKDDVPPHSRGDCADQYSDFAACLPIQSPSLMTEILSEFMDLVKTKEQELSSESSVSHLPPAVNVFPNQESVRSSSTSSVDSDPIVPPGCQLRRNISQREGLTTFTVVPRRRPPSLRQYEVLITLVGSESLEQTDEERGCITKQGDKLEWRRSKLENFKPKEGEKLEWSENEIVNLPEKDGNSENLEATDHQVGISEAVDRAFDKLKLNSDMEQHNAKEKEEDELSVEEEEEERDWVEEYRKRRRRFQGDEDNSRALKLERWMNADLREDGLNGFPPQPLSVYREEGENEDHQEREKTLKPRREEEVKDLNCHSEPSQCAVYTPGAYWDLNHSSANSTSGLDSGLQVPLIQQTADSCPSPSKPHSDSLFKHEPPGSVPTPPPSSMHSDRDDTSDPKTHPVCDPPSPAPMSLFALAVAQKAQSLRRGVCTLTPSTQDFCPQIQPSKVFCSQNPQVQPLCSVHSSCEESSLELPFH